MEGVVVNFKGGRHTQINNRMVLKLKDVDTKEKAKALLNKKVTWNTPTGKTITGIIKKVHGNSGALLAEFERGMPGQSISTKVKVE